MEGRTGTLFNHAHPNGIGVTVQEVDPESQEITFYMDPDADEIKLNLSNEQSERNDDELQENHDMYFVDWKVKMENQSESTLPPGGQIGNSNMTNNGAHTAGGKRKKRKTRMRRSRRVKKTRKSRK
jgi:hypothetical protein